MLATTPSYCQEGLILGAGGDLHSLDLKTGETTLIGLTGHHAYLWNGMAINSQNQIFAASGDDWAGFTIYEIDPHTGQGTPVVHSGLSEIGAMAFGPDETLYLSHDPLWPLAGGVHELHTLDLATGSTTFIGVTGSKDLLALDFSDGQLYGHSASQGLVRIDTTTGNASDVNPHILGPLGWTASMCFDQNGALYYVDHALWVMDKESGIRNPIDLLDVAGFWTEVVYWEGPSSGAPYGLMGQLGTIWVRK